jgi:PleD family two-component response regulator
MGLGAWAAIFAPKWQKIFPLDADHGELEWAQRESPLASFHCASQREVSCEIRRHSAAVQGAVMVRSDSRHSAIRILLVDDFEPSRRHVRSILQTWLELCVVAEVADGLEAVQSAQELKPDLILLDIGLPNLNGIEAASRIRKIVPDAKIISARFCPR